MNSNNVNVVQEIDEALVAESSCAEKRSEERLNAAERSRDKISRIGTFLRYIGVAILVAATGTFMFQRWGDMTHLARYFTFLAFTAGICGAGLLCGLKIRENKGARTLLGAVVTLIPVHCAQIGAILYSRLGQGVHASDYPTYLYWSVPSLSDAVLVTVGGLLALIPMAYMAYSVLARNYARYLLVLGCGVSSMLLVPTRDPVLVGIMLAVMATLAFVCECKFISVVELKTREAAVARAVPFLALAILIGRQCGLYVAPEFFIGMIFAITSAILFELLPRITLSKAVIGWSETASLYTTVFAAVFFGDGIINSFNLSNTVLAPLVLGLPVTVAFALMAARSRETAELFRRASAMGLFFTGGAELISNIGVDGCLIALIIGVISVTFACINEKKWSLFVGVALTVLSLGRGSILAVGSLAFSPWIILGVIGVGTILGASYLEKNFMGLRAGLFAARKKVSTWH